jgi:AcrR family transcriptional regulator
MPKIINDEQVFQAAVDIFTARGYHGATTNDIAMAAGINEVTLFRKYGNKANLITQAIRYFLSDMPLNQVTYTGNLTVDLEGIVQRYIETNALHGRIVPVLLSQIPHYPELKSLFPYLIESQSGVAHIIQTYQAQGVLIEEDVPMTMGTLLGPIVTRYMFQRAAGGDPAPIDIPQYVKRFLSGRVVER